MWHHIFKSLHNNQPLIFELAPKYYWISLAHSMNCWSNFFFSEIFYSYAFNLNVISLFACCHSLFPVYMSFFWICLKFKQHFKLAAPLLSIEIREYIKDELYYTNKKVFTASRLEKNNGGNKTKKIPTMKADEDLENVPFDI